MSLISSSERFTAISTRYWIRLLVLTALSCLPCLPSWSQSSASPYTTGYRYDAARRVTGVISPAADGVGPIKFAATRSTYDARGLLTRVETGGLTNWQSESVAPSSWTGFTAFRRTDYTYDAHGRKLSDQLSSGGVTYSFKQYSYDIVGRLDCATVRMNLSPAAIAAAFGLGACQPGEEGAAGPDRIVRNASYDGSDRPLTVLKAYGTALQQTYATNTYLGGHLATTADANGNVSKFQVDGLGRLEYWYFPSPTTAGQTNTGDFERYSYDENGNRTQLRKRDGSIINYGPYDGLNRTTRKDPPGTAADISYSYDLQGLVVDAHFTGTTTGLTNTFDGFGRIKKSTTNLGGVSRSIDYEYDADGNRKRITHPDGVHFDYVYDGLNRLAQIFENGDLSSPIVALTYDVQGRRTRLTRGASASVTTYGYDPISRLTSMSHNLDSNVTTSDVNQSFTFNPAHQTITRSMSNSAYVFSQTIPDRSYAVNGLNQYTQVGLPNTAYAYDPNGNLTSDGATTFVYDAENRLTSASGAKNASLSYDPNGRLYQATGSSTTRFLYDGDHLIEEYNGTGGLARRYVHGPGMDEPLVWYEGSSVGAANRRFLHANHQGSVIAFVSGTGATLEKETYDPYGVSGSTNSARFQYTGQAFLPDLGLYYYKARLYSPTLGRFMQTDPIGYESNLNLYVYASNDPMTRLDPHGTDDSPFSMGEANRITRELEKKDPEAAKEAQKKAAIAVGAAGLVIVAAPFVLPEMAVGGVVTAGAGGGGTAAATATAAATDAAVAAETAGVVSTTGAASAGLVAADGTVVTGVSTGAGGAGAAGSAETAALLEQLPAELRTVIAGQCAEWSCAAAAVEAGIEVEGATMAAVRIASKRIIEACPACKWMAEQLKINLVPKP